jgi:hypothetical protein
VLSTLSWKVNFHRRIGEERLAHRFAGCERRRAANDKAARVPEIRRHFERNMTAEAPPDEVGLVDRQRVQNGANRAGMARERIGARIFCVVRRAMAGKIDRDQPEALAERPFELTREDARGRRIAVDEHHGWTLVGRLVDGERAIRRFDFVRFHHSPQGNSNASTGTATHRGGRPPLIPFRKWDRIGDLQYP